MVELKENMWLYHGSFCAVKDIDLELCNPHKDFGKGFYVTSSREQAQSFVRLSLKRAKTRGLVSADQSFGYVSAFRLMSVDRLKIKVFSSADIEWLHYIAANRDETMFPGLPEQYREYDVVIGKIANDRTAATLQGYLENAFGIAGTEQADRIAIETLLPNKLEDQICLKTPEAVRALAYVESEKYGA